MSIDIDSNLNASKKEICENLACKLKKRVMYKENKPTLNCKNLTLENDSIDWLNTH